MSNSNNNFAKKSLGQHFLHDKNICNKIVGLLEVQNKDNILEIGPGTGALTNILSKQEYNNFTILEKDDRFAKLHTENNYNNTTVIHCDALKHNWAEIQNNIKIISNLPYNIASPLMWDIVSQTKKLDLAVFMIQDEVANRCIAEVNTKAYGVLSIWLQAFCEVKKEFMVKPQAFSPPPKVNSAVISLKPFSEDKRPKEPEILADLIKTCFQQRRKQIEGILKKSKYSHVYANMLENFNISPMARPENISVELFIAMSEYIKINKNK